MENPGTQVPFQTSQKLILRAAGDLRLLGSEEADLHVSSPTPELVQIKSEGNLVQVASNEDVWVRVPAGADVRVEHVGGDAVIFGLTGAVEVSYVGGDLKHNGAGKLDVGQVGGDLTAAGIRGMLTVRRVGGDFHGDVAGSVSVEMIGGDSNLRVSGGARLRTGGDIEMRIDAPAGEEVVLKAGGDINLSIGPDLSAQLDLSSGGRDISLVVNGKRADHEQPNVVLTLGKGERNIRAKAGGDINVSDSPIHLKNLADEFSHFEEEFKAGPVLRHRHSHHGPQNWNDFEERIRDRTLEATRRAEERVRAAMERVERDNKRRERSFGKMFGKGFGFINFGADMPTPPEPPSHPEAPVHPEAPGHPHQPAGSETQAPAAETPETAYNYEAASSVTNEERMLVLKMLQEHKITVEEAEQLLAELEGQFD